MTDPASERFAELVAELAEARSARLSAEETIERLRDELTMSGAQARDIARGFEQEAAARLEAEAIASTLTQELAQVRADADRVREELRQAREELERRRG